MIWRCCIKCHQQHLGGEHRTLQGEWCDEDVCKACGGEKVISIDTTDSRYEHTTKEVPCPDCGDTDDDIEDLWWYGDPNYGE